MNKKRINNLQIIYNNANYGIAKAINIGEKCLNKDVEFFFTFDQDSLPDVNMIFKMKEFINIAKETEISSIGVICPQIYDSNISKLLKPISKKYSEVKMCIQSGMLINREVFKVVDGFF